MKVKINEPVPVDKVDFKPRIVNQTTLYTFDNEMGELLSSLEEKYKEKFRFLSRKYKDEWQSSSGPWTLKEKVSFAEDVEKGLWNIEKLNVEKWIVYNCASAEEIKQFSQDAKSVLDNILQAFEPYTNRLEFTEDRPVVELNWNHKTGDAKYHLNLGFSSDHKWLIASPTIELDIIGGKTEYDESGRPLNHHVQDPFEGKDYREYQIYANCLESVLTGKPFEEAKARFVRMDYGIPEIATAPILATELDDVLWNFHEICHKVMEKKEIVYQAAKEARGIPDLKKAGETISVLYPAVIEKIGRLRDYLTG